MQYSTYSNRGGRPVNEDSVQVKQLDNDRMCLVVADGLGGHGGGRQASSLVASTICANWQGQGDPETLRSLVTQAHRAVQSIQTPQCQMKSTAVVLEVSGKTAACAHVGDSRLYHFVDGNLAFQTKDHSASQVAVLLGDITPAEIRFHVDRNRILRALGQDGTVQVDSGSIPLGPGQHSFLLCTDGFWEYVVEEEMERDLRASCDPQDWLRRMRARLEGRVPEDCDNHTAAALWLNG